MNKSHRIIKETNTLIKEFKIAHSFYNNNMFAHYQYFK